MIFTDLKSLPNYFTLFSGIEAAYNFLIETEHTQLSEGKHLISGDDVFALVSSPGNSENNTCMMEAHRQFLDIHIARRGSEVIGWKDLTLCTHPDGEYSEEKDVILFHDKDYTQHTIANNSLMLFLPHDCHAPGLICKDLVKIVIKIKIK
jgi:YhcH/YjgK/YiaL family protein